jgi:glucose-1-phosphate thymidylyltransferase
MKIIIPMAGKGKRMRPHTLSVPKPLIPVAGVPVVKRLVKEIAKVTDERITEIAFIIGDFGEEVEESLKSIAKSLKAKPKIYYQKEALGTAHAIYCAKDSLNEKVIIAFADTLFVADFKLDVKKDGIIWVQKVKNPSAFGVVKVNDENIITDFVEKPQEHISDLAIIGIYYFKDGKNLKKELKYLIDNEIIVSNEYQLTNALENMKNKNVKFFPGQVDEWLDCGNKNATVYTNQRILENIKNEKLISDSAKIINSIVIEPCFIGNNVKIEESIIGPHVSIGNETIIKDSVVKNCIIQSHTEISDVNLRNSMIGNYVQYNQTIPELSVGDYTQINFQ